MSNKLAGCFCTGLLLLLLTARASAGEIESLLQGEMRVHHVAGMACLVIKNGRPTTRFFAGNANLEWPTHVDTSTVFEVGSVSKQFAAASILLLVEDGKLSLDDSILKFFTNAPVAWKDVKVRHLLSHTSGIRSYEGLDGFELRRHLTQAQFIERLSTWEPMQFAPGESWSLLQFRLQSSWLHRGKREWKIVLGFSAATHLHAAANDQHHPP